MSLKQNGWSLTISRCYDAQMMYAGVAVSGIYL
jgi:hypothetical protein